MIQAGVSKETDFNIKTHLKIVSYLTTPVVWVELLDYSGNKWLASSVAKAWPFRDPKHQSRNTVHDKPVIWCVLSPLLLLETEGDT